MCSIVEGNGIQIDDYATYSCKASNTAGESEQAFEVNVNVICKSKLVYVSKSMA